MKHLTIVLLTACFFVCCKYPDFAVRQRIEPFTDSRYRIYTTIYTPAAYQKITYARDTLVKSEHLEAVKQDEKARAEAIIATATID
ncbi:hypothetical protein [Foetidibacter luteolus]|uniref:hypothetical protein n=1 Tax=Foetidibacter luteolus TaxID=2608880 RepID=UPI00129A8A77|nr:hypothetical protein [Foetidibacter luteolus]